MAKIERKLPILAIDASSTATGLALWNKGKLVATRVIKVDGDFRRLVTMGDRFADFLREHNLWERGMEVWIEEPFYAPGRSNDLPIKMIHGILMYIAAEKTPASRFLWNYVSVSTWRKQFISKRVKSKEAKQIVMAAVSKQFDIEVIDDNVGDAMGILSWRLGGNSG